MVTLRFGIAPANQRELGGKRQYDVDGFLREVRAAERAGFDRAYTGERRSAGPTSYSHNPLLLSLHGLDHTERIGFAAGLVVLPLHHPVQVVQDASVVDTLHPGRFRLCVGAGYMESDFQALGVPHGERGVRMEQGLAAINAYHSGAQLELDGPYRGRVPLRDEALHETPVEVFCGAWSEAGVRRAARYADGWITGPIRNVRWLAELADIYREECAEVGREPRIAMLREAWLADSDAKAREEYGEYVLGYHRIYFERGNAYDPRWEPWLDEVAGPDDLTLDHVVPDRVLLGGPETWRATLGEWVELIRPEEVILRLRHVGGPAIEAVEESIHAIGREVIDVFSGPPHVHER